MDCCCQRQQSTLSEHSAHNSMKTSTHKLKYSFRTQQTTTYNNSNINNNNLNINNNNNNLYNTNITNTRYSIVNNNNLLTNSSYINPSQQLYNQPIPQQQKMLSTVASNNELIQLQRQRQILINQQRQLDMFYNNRIVPLQRQVSYFQQQVKVRSIQIMELQSMLNDRVRERGIVYIGGDNVNRGQGQVEQQRVVYYQQQPQQVIMGSQSQQPQIMRGIPTQQFIHQQQLTNQQQTQIQPQHLISTIHHQPTQPFIPHHNHQPVIMHQIRSPSQTILHQQQQPIFNN